MGNYIFNKNLSEASSNSEVDEDDEDDKVEIRPASTNLSLRPAKKRKLNRPPDTDTSNPSTSSNSNSTFKPCCSMVPFDQLNTPIVKKMKSTTNYIYNTLFINGEGSDIIVKALNKEWKLHKIYLCQSPYFDSMFKGCKWKESFQSYIEISIPDQNINERALCISFGSFYKEEIELSPMEVVNVLACASLFSLDGLLNQCSAIMLENICANSFMSYYDASLVYGVKQVTEKILKWLSYNLMINQDIRLELINMSLFESILDMKDLMIIQVETDLYTLCKKWLYLQLNKDNLSQLNNQANCARIRNKISNEFFKSIISNFKENTCLLEDPKYEKYSVIFKKIRLNNIMHDISSLKLIYDDMIIPKSWIEPYYCKNWLNLLFVDQDRLSSEYEIDTGAFENQCFRFGRILNDDSTATWRWVGFNYGIDMLITHSSRQLTLKRNTINLHSPYKGLLSNRPVLRFYYLIKLLEQDKLGNERSFKKTDVTYMDLNRNEEKLAYVIDSKVQYPLILNFFITTHPLNNTYLSNETDAQQV